MKYILSFIMFLACLAASAKDFTYTYEGQTLTYTILDEEAKTCKVAENKFVSGKVVIPSEIKYGGYYYKVTEIGDSAFSRYCSSLTSVDIPNSVTTIGNYAFHAYLDSVNIHDIAAWCNIQFGNNLFYTIYDLYLNGEKVTNLVIPEGVTTIGDRAFQSCSSLTSVNIHDIAAWCNIQFGSQFGKEPFSGYDLYLNGEKVTNLVIPEGVTTISDHAFQSCSSLTSVVIPNSVTSIGKGAFDGCSGLTSIAIPSSVTSIGDYAFNSCTALKKLVIEEGTDTLTLGNDLFESCPLESLYLGRNLSYGNSDRDGYSPFYNKSTLTEVTIGNSVTSIGNCAFAGCTGLTDITIPNSVTSIGSSAFYDCI